MVAIPQAASQTVEAIYRSYEARRQDHRPHLGASIIGDPCSRKLWYTFRWALRSRFEGRILRLFETGKLEEGRLIKDLRAIGVEVHQYSEGRKQWTVQACGGHFGGSLDGAALGLPEAPKTWHVLEFKTANDNQFKKLAASGVKSVKPEHYAQMQVYMGLTGMERAAYICVNKNTDEIHFERVERDLAEFGRLLEKAEAIIYAQNPPPKIADTAEGWSCKYCAFKVLCHQGGIAEINCRTCLHSTPTTEGTWLCEKKSKLVNLPTQRKGCDKHLYIPALVNMGEPIFATDDSVTYLDINGRRMTNTHRIMVEE